MLLCRRMTAKARPRPLVLVVLDGFGERQESADNAVLLARTPALTELFGHYPRGLVGTSGPDVGLPPGQMGNSEVGHLNLGAGRIAMMDISRIDNAVHDGDLAQNQVIIDVIDKAKKEGGRLHLIGLLSDGGVHSSLSHLFALIGASKRANVPVVVHVFLDGRDVQPGTGAKFVAGLEQELAGGVGSIGTVAGRYWGMDRDNRWERVERSYRAIVEGQGARAGTAGEGVQKSYGAGKTDEFVEPFVVGAYAGLKAGDAALHFNFRPDRARELTRALAMPEFDAFPRIEGRAPLQGRFACMTTYDARFGLPIAFPKETYSNIFPEIIARAGLKQFRCAETEKYAHVTYFFNGGREEPFEGESRKMLPSPKDVSTYDEKPEMSAAGVAQAVQEAIESGTYDFVLVNFANPDMLGHTGVLGAAIRAVEVVDAGVDKIVKAARAAGGAVLITADHGNCELMKDPVTGQPHTSHTLNPVPFVYINDSDRNVRIRKGGRLCDVAPTMLDVLHLQKPADMTGVSLLTRE
jgi:2,3-bisphosphoglycerate-independent phosphoglycerate mutase